MDEIRVIAARTAIRFCRFHYVSDKAQQLPSVSNGADRRAHDIAHQPSP